MHELVITRHNELIDPLMHVWGWEIPVYLFLGGWVAGMMVIFGFFLLRRQHTERQCVCAVLPLLAVTFLSLGMFALFLDLEHKLYFWRLYTTVEPWSPMSWGAWILLLVYPALLVGALVRVPPLLSALVPPAEKMSSWVLDRPRLVWSIGGLNMVLGVLLGVYTGILLSALAARPLWNSAILGPLFLLSGMSSAAAFVHMVARRVEERELLAKADNGFLLAELAVLALFLIGLVTSTEAHQQAAWLFLGGPYTAVFWVFVVALGIVIPLFLQSLAVTHRIVHTSIPPILVMAGGLALRFVFVYAGQASHWVADLASR